jgi:hypothetical protein
MAESFDSSFVSASSRRVTSDGLVIVRVVKLIVPLITALVLGTIPVLAMVLDPVMSVPATDDVPSVSCTLTLTALIWRA